MNSYDLIIQNIKTQKSICVLSNLEVSKYEAFERHKIALSEVHEELLSKTSQAPQDLDIIIRQDYQNWFLGASNPVARTEYITMMKEEATKWVAPTGTTRHAITIENNNDYNRRDELNLENIDSCFTILREKFPDYQTVSSNFARLLKVDPVTEVKVLDVLRTNKYFDSLESIYTYNDIKTAITQILFEIPPDMREQLVAFCKISASHELYCLINLETSVFCCISVMSFMTIFFPIHHPGQLTQLLTEANELIVRKGVHLISEKKRFITYKAKPTLLQKTKGFIISHKRTITWIGGGVLSGGVISYLFKDKFAISSKTSRLESIFPKDIIKVGQGNLNYLAYTIANTLSGASRAGFKGWLEPWLKTMDTKEIQRILWKK